MLTLVRGDLARARAEFQCDLDLCKEADFAHGQAFALRNSGKGPGPQTGPPPATSNTKAR